MSAKRKALATFLAALAGGVDAWTKQIQNKQDLEAKRQDRATEFAEKLAFQKQLLDYKSPIEERERRASALLKHGLDPSTGQMIPEIAGMMKQKREQEIADAKARAYIGVGGNPDGSSNPTYLDLLTKKTSITNNPKDKKAQLLETLKNSNW